MTRSRPPGAPASSDPARGPDQLLANPRNWRTTRASSAMALRGSLEIVGWVQQVLVNKTTGHVVDGHARMEEAICRGEAEVPVSTSS